MPKQSKKALIITYYWPPAGGSPVLRWLNFTKYLCELGWDVSIYTPENPVPQAIDKTLLEEIPPQVTILKRKIWEPYSLLNSLTGKKKDENQATAFISESKRKSRLSEFAIWLRGNFFIPDARMFWIRPSIRSLSRYLKVHPHDIIISTGPPHSMHLIAQGIKRKLKLPWIADFRDPWTNIDYYNQLKLSAWADNRHHRLEQSVLHEANRLITVSPTMTYEFNILGADRVDTITNGFDTTPKSTTNGTDNFTLLHVGSMPESRNPETLWKVLSQLVQQQAEWKQKLRIELIGKVDHSVLQSIENFGLSSALVRSDHISNHLVLEKMAQASALLLVINNTPNASGILTNKFFEYLSAKRPIVAVGPINGDAAKILQQTGAGEMLGYTDDEKTKTYLSSLFNSFTKGTLTVDVKHIDKYHRKNLTLKLAELMDSLTQ